MNFLEVPMIMTGEATKISKLKGHLEVAWFGTENGKPMICISELNKSFKIKEALLHEMIHYFLWNKYALNIDIRSLHEKEFRKIGHTKEFIEIYKDILKKEFSVKLAENLYNHEYFIDENKEVRYFKKLVPFNT